ncbi:aminopeptidase P family protein [Aquihabitans sp. G128]|uniref:aminopeptidase P family protein n=1 Tax=Aquihabitans sp. G128 TaxID=2849779 RepID=UPI001C22DC5F|nr:aminopeptidase P family protein [Aquihabitans sp. G128]QXC62224.1 aminopeptidase P family protein [Aquihabitans sp. G128]
MTEHDESERRARLLDAQAQAEQLFVAVEDRGIIRPGTTDKAASHAIRDLAAELFGVRRHRHKRIVRSGPHSVLPGSRRNRSVGTCTEGEQGLLRASPRPSSTSERGAAAVWPGRRAG